MAGSRVVPLPRDLRHVARSVVPYLSTTALLGLTAAFAFVTMGLPRPTREDAPTHRPALIRALHATAGEVDDDLLVEASFTPDELPGSDAEAIFYRLTLPPGTSLPAPAGPLCLCRNDFVAAGVGVEVVESGAYSLLLETPLRVRRAGASQEEAIAARRDVVLGPGDAAIFGDYAAAGTLRNAGQDPVIVIGMAVVSKEGTGIALPLLLPEGANVELLAGSLPSDWETMPPGPVALSLWRLRMPAGTRVGPYAGAGLEALAVESGSISRLYLRLAEHTPNPPPLVQYPGVQSIFLAPAPGIRRSIASDDANPAVLVAASIESETIWSATLAP